MNMLNYQSNSIFIMLFALVIQVAFAIAVFKDAQKVAADRGTVFVPPIIWAAATLFGSVYVTAVYWAMHHSSLAANNFCNANNATNSVNTNTEKTKENNEGKPE